MSFWSTDDFSEVDFDFTINSAVGAGNNESSFQSSFSGLLNDFDFDDEKVLWPLPIATEPESIKSKSKDLEEAHEDESPSQKEGQSRRQSALRPQTGRQASMTKQHEPAPKEKITLSRSDSTDRLEDQSSRLPIVNMIAKTEEREQMTRKKMPRRRSALASCRRGSYRAFEESPDCLPMHENKKKLSVQSVNFHIESPPVWTHNYVRNPQA